MALAYGTPVAVPDGTRLVEQIAIGDQVLASGSPLAWAPATVEFSTGIEPGQPITMVYLRWGQESEIIATPDHIFVLLDSALTPADTLRPGDQLLTADGTQALLEQVLMGEYMGGIHALGTAVPWNPDSLDGRLLSTGGVVTGDYQLEIHFQGTDRPRIGTPEYDQAQEGRATQSHADLKNL